ncbi:MAG TPA: DUF2147 domain-containing protein [Xanthobacteraceae bacterium]|jgi:uncharacterized protein (DUF2147 family)
MARLLHGCEPVEERTIPKGAEMRLPILTAESLVACSLALGSTPAAAADPRGVWLVEDKSAQIQVENCGGALWGVVAWERMPGHDNENPDPALRGRPTLGIPILLGMRPEGPPEAAGTVWRGHIYNAMNGRTYDANIRLASPVLLHLEGCVLGGLFCGGQDWARVRTPAAAPATDVCSRISDLARGTH